ncbi:hypothetical protein JAAARDRAFT_123635 [Jaapia argillacea MUCL 33604]|uniref:CHAT domain-containing protein n=1 Tax=Jaapia argillacea MUCL 33604 TaxID=933084 RepID=A0A067Q475_9AGAM|nr:hypothetical protein JAAARDRAFT_123635 [Jaapia argillacea MUCL 33604]
MLDCEPPSVTPNLPKPPSSPAAFNSTDFPSPPKDTEKEAELSWAARRAKDRKEHEELIESDRKSLDLLPVGDPTQVDVLLRLSAHLLDNYWAPDRMGCLQESISYIHDALALCRAGHPLRSSCLRKLADALCARCRRSYQIVDVVDAIKYCREDLVLCPAGHAERADSLEGLADALTLHQMRSGSGDEFEEIIKCHLEILTLRPSDRFHSRRNLLSMLHLRLDHSGDLDELINFTHVNLDLLLDQTDGDTPPRRDISVMYQFQSNKLHGDYLPDGKETRLEHAIECARKALDLRPVGDPGRDEVLCDLSRHLEKRYKLCSRKEDLEESITHAQEALALRPVGHNGRASALTILATALHSSLEGLADTLTLQQQQHSEHAIECGRKALDLRPVGDPGRDEVLCDLSRHLEKRYKLYGRKEDLEESITHAQEALALRPAGHNNRAYALTILATALYSSLEGLANALTLQQHRKEDLEESITHAQEALALRPTGHDNRASTLTILAIALLSRYMADPGQSGDFEEAIGHHSEALGLHPVGHPERWTALRHLANAFEARYDHSGSMNDLESAIQYGAQALDLRPDGESGRDEVLFDLNRHLYEYCVHSQRNDYLNEAITHGRAALALRPSSHVYHLPTLINLTLALKLRWETSPSQLDDLEEAIAMLCKYLNLPSIDPVNRIKAFFRLSDLSNSRRLHAGSMEDLEAQANQFAQEVLDTIPSVQQKYHFYHELAAVLRDRYYHEGQLAALEDSIKYFRLCLGLLHEHDDKRSHVLTNLSRVLRSRFRHSSQIEDLKEMVRYAREALNLHPVGHSRRSSSLNGLASALEKYQRYDGTSSLDEVIQLRLASLDLIPPRDGRRGNILNGLGCTFQTRYDSSKKMHDLNEAIDYHNDALSFFNNQNSSRAGVLADIAVALRCRYQGVTDEDDLKMGIERLREARTCLPDGHQRTAWVLRELAVMLLTGKEPPTAHHADEAFTLLADAAHHKAASSRQQLNAAREWISRAVHHHHHSALDAYTCALALLHKCLATRPDVTAQQEFLGAKGKSLACDAAAFAIKEGKVEMALEMLEHGRTILWSKLRGYRESLHVLADADPSLCTHFEDVSAKLEHITTVIDSDSDSLSLEQEDIHADPSTAWDTRMRDHCLLSEEWDDVVDRIRKLHGFEDFLKAVPYATLRQVAIESVVVVINISKHRSDALILQGSNPPAVVCLPKATPKYLKRLSAKLFRAVESDDTDRQKRILPVLRGLWHNVMFPIHNQLASLGVPEMAHIWLCPTSVLCGLPLHAAGSYMPRVRNLPDLYVCSYTPTLSALITARSGLAEPLCSPQLLAVCQPADDLRRADEEIQCVEALGSFVVTLFGAEATPESVLSQLQEHQWTHFACHGHRDEDPFKSFLRLHGRNLTVREMMTARLPNAEFAFLSACHTAAVDTEGALDEVIHITSALQFAGFRSVVGTLWQAPDDIGPDLAKEFYQHMFHRSDGPADFRDAAKALSLATRAMRQKGVSLDRWIQYVHIGA